jgi:hypothetical protein
MKPSCALCWIDKRTGRRGSHEATGICIACRNKPENREWIRTWEEVGVEDDVAASDRHLPAQTLAEAMDRRFNPTPMQGEILKLIAFGTVETRVQRWRSKASKRVRRGRRWVRKRQKRGFRVRTRPMSISEIAREVGCSVRYVEATRRRFARDLNV